MSFDFYTSAFHPKALKNVCLMWQVFWLGLRWSPSHLAWGETVAEVFSNENGK